MSGLSESSAVPRSDSRRIKVAAPPDGGRSAPPARRRRVVVEPTKPPASAQRSESPQRVVIPAPGTGGNQPPPRAKPAATATATRPPRARTEPADRRSTGWRRVLPSRRVVLAIAGVLLLLVAGTLLYGYAKFRSIERIDLASVLADDNGTNYLIVGSDTRAGVDPNAPNAGAILGDDSVGGPERSDTILILRIDGDGARMLSVPRDLWVTISETGQRSRINSAFNGGPARLILTLRDQLQLPIHHYVQVDFVSFSSMVDSLGGITIEFPNPAFDTRSGLNVPEAGRQELDGSQALAYVRSRYYTEVIDGRNVPEGIGDIGRVQRQQRFLAALTSEMRSTKNPLAMMQIADTLSGGMKIDSDLGFFEALNLLRKMQGLEPGENQLPTSNFRTAGGADVLRLEAGADEVLARFGSPGAAIT